MRRLLPVLMLASCAAPPASQPVACPTVPLARPSAHADPLPPVSAVPLTLRPAHWDWQDGGYVWAAAAWVPRSNDHPVWQEGFWMYNGATCAWVPGHFLP